MNDTNCDSDICSPIEHISEVLNWSCNGKCWIHKHDVVQLNNRSTHLNIGCALDFRNKKDVFSEFKLSNSILPKTLFCHDYKGGYLEDKFCNGSENIITYRFFNWSGIDIFIYFSHKLVTIPTQGWLNAGHIHGVPVLGTIITECVDGEDIWREILTDIEKTNLFSKRLAELCAHYKYDGYLVNVENKIAKDYTPRLVQFLALLKAHLDLFCARKTWLIWYDAVTTAGTLEWQNKLNSLNKPFFDVCDGIFLNYVWTPADLIESLQFAAARKHEVYVGVDVWGRNCYQNGGFDTDKAMAVVRSLGMSVALFAPAWTFETLPTSEDFLTREITFWKKCWSYLSVHGPAQLPFETNFCQGITFDKTSGKPWFNLGMQQYQPTGQCCSTDLQIYPNCISIFLNDGLVHNGACLKISASCSSHTKIFHRVFVCNFSGNPDEKVKVQVKLMLKTMDMNLASNKFRLYFVLEDTKSIEGEQRASMISRPKGYRSSCKLGQIYVSGSLIDFTAEEQVPEGKKIIVFQKEGDSESVPNRWQEVIFQLDLSEGQVISELLVLPAPEGSILWGNLKVEVIG